jgi:hypothetical protein
MKVTPSAKHTPFFWSVVEKSYYEELVRTVGAEEGMKSVLAESLAPFATDFGNIYDALEIITSYNDVSVEGTTYGLEQGKEYIPWAVAIDNSGNATAEFVMGDEFKTKIDSVADCTVEVKGSFETGSDGKAVLISTAKPDDKCVNFYNVIFQGDLRDASRQSLLNNIIKMGFKNQREVKFEKCPWNQPASAIAVGVDADGKLVEGSEVTWNGTSMTILSSGVFTKAYNDELATDVYNGKLVIEFYGEEMGLDLYMYGTGAASSVDVVITDANITVDEWGSYLVSAPWEDGILTIEVSDTEYEGFMMIEYTITEDDWYIWMAYTATVTTVDNVMTIEGEFTDNYTGTTYNVTISGNLPNGTGTGLEDATVTIKAVKKIQNGQLIIEKDGVQYNANGAQL